MAVSEEESEEESECDEELALGKVYDVAVVLVLELGSGVGSKDYGCHHKLRRYRLDRHSYHKDRDEGELDSVSGAEYDEVVVSVSAVECDVVVGCVGHHFHFRPWQSSRTKQDTEWQRSLWQGS